MKTNSITPCAIGLAVGLTLVLAEPPRLLAQTYTLDNFNSGNIVVSSSTSGAIIQYVPVTPGGVREISFGKADESSASSLTIGAGVLTFNATSPGDWFEVADGYVPNRTVNLTPYNAFALTVLDAPAGWPGGDLTTGAGSLDAGNGTIAIGAPASLLDSGIGTAVFPFSWWDGSGVDFHNIFEVEVDFYAEVPGTYVLDNFQAVVVPEPATAALGLLGGFALRLGASPSHRRPGGWVIRR